jgi:two-component system, chemotaxis family, chemotaxis protein CheY
MMALVVDDSAAMRRIQQKALEAQGWLVECVATGEEALEKLNTIERCDLVVTDWHMPGMGGIALVEAIRANPRFAQLKILMVTSDSMMQSVEQAIAAGANDFVMKPFTNEALMERVNAVMASA